MCVLCLQMRQVLVVGKMLKDYQGSQVIAGRKIVTGVGAWLQV